jgi:hypothetical protein
MIRQILVPKDNRLVLELPDHYLNQPVEIIVFKLQETVLSADAANQNGDLLAIFDQYAGSFDGKFNREELYDR